jgi:hypothetical protein
MTGFHDADFRTNNAGLAVFRSRMMDENALSSAT